MTAETPLQAIALLIAGRWRTVYLKLEGCGFAGSSKGRTARSLIEDLEQRGLGTLPDPTIIESTSGNTGVAMATLARDRGYRFMAVVDPKATTENLARMQQLGAIIEKVDEPDETGGYLLARLARVAGLRVESPGMYWPDQYANTANPRAHERWTGPEIWRQMDGRVGAIFVAVSTGGTLAGISRFFRARSPLTLMVAVDVCGSVALGGAPGPRRLTGIGSSIRSEFLTPDLYNESLHVLDEQAVAFCRAVGAATGVYVGGSSGAVLAACAQYLADHPLLDRVVCLSADGGENYRQTIYDDGWLRRQGLLLCFASIQPVQDIALASQIEEDPHV